MAATPRPWTTLADQFTSMENRQQQQEHDLGLLRSTVHALLLENRQLALGVSPKALQQQRVVLGQHDAAPVAPAQGPPLSGDVDMSLRAYLERLRLGHFTDRILNLGAEAVADLVDVEADDLEAIGMSKLERNRFFRAVQAQGLLSERAAIRHGDALEMLLHVTQTEGALEASVAATGWEMQSEWVEGTRGLLRDWEASGGRLEQARHQQLMAVALTAAELEKATERLLHCLRTSIPSMTVQLTGCGAIQRLAAADAKRAIELSNAGACLDVLRAFRYHNNDATLAIEGLHALASLARSGGPQVGVTLGATGAIATALECMHLHADDSEVFGAACALLQAVPIAEFWERTAHAEAAAVQQRRRVQLQQQRDMNQRQRDDDNADRSQQEPPPSTLAVVVRGITRYWEHASAQAAACALVEHLVEHSEDSKSLVMAADCVRVVIGALKGKKTAAVADNRDNANALGLGDKIYGRAGGVGALVAVARQARQLDAAARLHAHGCGVLGNLASGNAVLACEIRQAGGEAAANTAMSRHSGDERVV